MIYKFEAIQKNIFRSIVEAESEEEALQKIKDNEYAIEKVDLENIGLEDIKFVYNEDK